HLSDPSIAFVIAHELAHLSHKDTLVQMKAISSVLIIEILQLCLFPILLATPLVMLTEVVANPIFECLSRYSEKRADLKAMQILNSNNEAIQYFYSRLNKSFYIKHAPTDDLTKGEAPLPVVAHLKRVLTPHGNYRGAHSHPPLTERLKM